ncbi:MAG: hypothetical protein BWX47_01432 [candidate division Hyd24-12 bacterium ADurb.Bin004]|nr:MAG: hypothetical protein BWX47_01432 [candidate division Hyd24-12 bacterium ADurb.Bin004]
MTISRAEAARSSRGPWNRRTASSGDAPSDARRASEAFETHGLLSRQAITLTRPSISSRKVVPGWTGRSRNTAKPGRICTAAVSPGARSAMPAASISIPSRNRGEAAKESLSRPASERADLMSRRAFCLYPSTVHRRSIIPIRGTPLISTLVPPLIETFTS